MLSSILNSLYSIGRITIGYTKFIINRCREPHKLGKNIIAVPYMYHDKKYYKLISVASPKITIIDISDDNQHDLTDRLKPYFGKDERLDVMITPYIFGYKKLIFKIMHNNTGDVDTLTFNENDYIVFK